MKKQIITSLIIFTLVAAIAGCGQSEAKGRKEAIAQPTNPPIVGKILYGWTGFDERKYGTKWGYCIYENGKIKKALPNTSYANWIESDTILRFSDNENSVPGSENKLQIIRLTADEKTDLSVPRGIGRYKMFSDNQRMLVQFQESENKKYVSNLAVYDIELKDLKKITNFPLGERWSISGFDLSPDEAMIVYSYHHENSLESKIEIIDLEGKKVVDIPGQGGKSPAWSPDGKTIAFNMAYHNERTGRGDVEITLYNLETKEVKRLTYHEGIAARPAFSPDGKQIVYVLWGDGGRANNLAVINIDGTGFRTLLPEDHIRQGQVSNPDWGP